MVGLLGSRGDILSCCFYDGVQTSGFGEIVILGAAICNCLCWVGVFNLVSVALLSS